MSSNEKNIISKKSKYKLKTGNGVLTQIGNSQPKSVHEISMLKNETQVNLPNINKNTNTKYNKISPVKPNNQGTSNNIQQIKLASEISKVYSLSKPKNEKLVSDSLYSKYKLAKIDSNDLTGRINGKKILDKYSYIDNSTKALELNSFKIDTNSTFNELNKNKMKILNESSTTNNSNNSTNCLRKLYIKKNVNENLGVDSMNDSSNNINIINKTSLNNSKYKNSNKNKNGNNSNVNLNASQEKNNIKIILPNSSLFEEKIIINCKNSNIYGVATDISTTKNNKVDLLNNTNPEKKIKFFDGSNPRTKNKNSNNNIVTLKSNQSEGIINESIGSSNRSNSILLKNITIKKKKKYRCPEELHFYYISVLQEGKKSETNFEGE